jgi:hypothetical protein
VLTLCLSYGGRAEIVDAARQLSERVSRGELAAKDIDENAFRSALYDPALPDPDLLIRTSGEMRVSNFLLWQIAYSEIWVTETLWPDFTEGHLLDAVDDYMKRERRYEATRERSRHATHPRVSTTRAGAARHRSPCAGWRHLSAALHPGDARGRLRVSRLR